MESSKPVGAESYTEEYYQQACGGSEFFRRYGARVLKPVLAHALRRAAIEPGMAALDVGCGRGELLHHLRERGALAVGLDYADAALRLARETSKAPVLRADAKNLPFRERSFDRIFFLGVVDHLHDWELEACFAQFARLLKPGGRVLANTCTNTDYHKKKTYALRRRLAGWLGLPEPTPQRSDEDERLHVNEHNESGLRRFLERIGWEGTIEARPNSKYLLDELYGRPLPEGFPLRGAGPWKRAAHRLIFRGPWKRCLARELFCEAAPRGK